MQVPTLGYVVWSSHDSQSDKVSKDSNFCLDHSPDVAMECSLTIIEHTLKELIVRKNIPALLGLKGRFE